MTRQQGFNLVELSIMVLLISLLVGGMVMPTVQYAQLQQIRQTENALVNIKESLLNYAATHGRLPCPAQANRRTGDHADAGLERYDDNGTPNDLADDGCAAVQGVLPWRELGVPERDAWGHRYTYRISPKYAEFDDDDGCREDFSFVWFSLCTDARNEIRTAATGGQPMATQVVAVVVSHGANGYGGFNSEGQRTPDTAASADEIENQGAGGIDRFFIQRGYHAEQFDDLLTWVAKPQLMTRMVKARKIP